jgi:deazaflavin-dependent oxidoreductase (nitroreductase family)
VKTPRSSQQDGELRKFADLDYCYLTTVGRLTGLPRTIEIWFAVNEQTLYLLAGDGEKAGWVKNLKRTPEVEVRLNRTRFTGRARIVKAVKEDTFARQLVFAKYQPRYSGDLSSWRDTALPVAVTILPRAEKAPR